MLNLEVKCSESFNTSKDLLKLKEVNRILPNTILPSLYCGLLIRPIKCPLFIGFTNILEAAFSADNHCIPLQFPSLICDIFSQKICFKCSILCTNKSSKICWHRNLTIIKVTCKTMVKLTPYFMLDFINIFPFFVCRYNTLPEDRSTWPLDHATKDLSIFLLGEENIFSNASQRNGLSSLQTMLQFWTAEKQSFKTSFTLPLPPFRPKVCFNSEQRKSSPLKQVLPSPPPPLRSKVCCNSEERKSSPLKRALPFPLPLRSVQKYASKSVQKPFYFFFEPSPIIARRELRSSLSTLIQMQTDHQEVIWCDEMKNRLDSQTSIETKAKWGTF